MALPPRVITTDRGDAGRRLDLVVRRHLVDLSSATRTRVQAWIEGGRVTVNGQTVSRVSSRAALGDTITVSLPDEQPRAPVLAEQVALERLFEDDQLLVVNKPAGMVSHPTFRHPSGTLMNALLGYAGAWPSARRPSLVGRLDKDTSGALLVAKTIQAHGLLQRTLTSSRSEKTYLAVCYGTVEGRGEITLRLGRHPDDRRRVIASTILGRPSTTRFEGLATGQLATVPVSLVMCRLMTGRMHQIRVHLAAREWPIVGDAKYGGPAAPRRGAAAPVLDRFPRQALHSWRLTFTHPFTREVVSLEAPVPPDMRSLIDACGFE